MTKKHGKAPHTFKDNFWSKLRVSKNVTIRELADLLDIGEKRMGLYFSGQLMPNDAVIKQLCDVFDVDFIQGQLAFQSAHRLWRAEHNRKCIKVEREPETPCEEVCEGIPVSELKVPFDTRAVLKLLYGKVDHDVYCFIEDLFNNLW